MIKYFCDICGKELNKKEQHYVYILPQQVPYDAISAQGEPVYTYEQLEDREVEVCDICRRKISQAVKEIGIKEKS